MAVKFTKLLTIAAAVAAVGTVAVYVVKRLRQQGHDVEGVLDDVLDFCQARANELDRLIGEIDASVAGA